MTFEGAYEPSPRARVAEQVRLYEGSGGVEGGTLEGQPCVILTTLGRRSASVRKTPLMRVEHDGTYAVVASQGARRTIRSGTRTSWRTPRCSSRTGRASAGSAPRGPWCRARPGGHAAEVWSPYDEYQTRTDRVIPVVVLEPLASS